jgi:hypothetical protein
MTHKIYSTKRRGKIYKAIEATCPVASHSRRSVTPSGQPGRQRGGVILPVDCPLGRGGGGGVILPVDCPVGRGGGGGIMPRVSHGGTGGG